MNSPASSQPPKTASLLSAVVIVASLGYFVDIYDLVLFSIVRVKSLNGLGVLEPSAVTNQGIYLIDMQMGGMLLGGILWGIWATSVGGYRCCLALF